MSPRIQKTTVRLHHLTPAEAEVWVTAELNEASSGLELRGRLVGPRCPGATTVEVAYPFRPCPEGVADQPHALAVRAFIPEPSIWTEQTPFVYEGPLELWRDGECQDKVKVTVGLRFGNSHPR
jgi:glycosyl hydrolase family 2